MPSRHSKLFGASSSSRWMNCEASVLLEQEEEFNTVAADEGTMGHHFTELTLQDRLLARQFGDDPLIRHVKAYKGKMHANTRLAEIHLKHLEGYVNFVWSLVAVGGKLYVEREVDYSAELGVDHLEDLDRAFGTADAFVFMPDGTLWVIDLKFGLHIVDAENNSQMMFYAIGGHKMLRGRYDIKRFNLVIYQPRTKGRPDDTWACTFDHLRRHTAKGHKAAQRILIAKKHLEDMGCLLPEHYGPSVKTCEWCKVKKCEARRKSWSRRYAD